MATQTVSEIGEILSNLSATHRQFVEHATSNPEFHKRANFRDLEVSDCLIKDPIQSWPTFIDARAVRELGQASVGLCRLIRRLPEDVFGLDPALMAEYYEINADFVEHVVLPHSSPLTIDSLLARGDFIWSADGPQCIEFNIASNLGGISEARTWEQRMTAIPLIGEYIREHGLRVQSRDTLRLMFEHVLRQAGKSPVATQGDVNMVYIMSEAKLADEDREAESYFEGHYREALTRSGISRGRFFLCGVEDLDVIDGTLYCAGQRIHIAIEFLGGVVPFHLLRCQQRNNLWILNGPFTYVACNKLNMALLSELEGSDFYTGIERELIRRHVPWTRKVSSSYALVDSEEVDLPEYISRHRESLVLKRAISRSGQDVIPGTTATMNGWDAAINQALEDKDWIVQRYVACPAYPYQRGIDGYGAHDVIWGPFVFGDTYGGAFLRMLPQDLKSVVNASRGSSDGVVLEVL